MRVAPNQRNRDRRGRRALGLAAAIVLTLGAVAAPADPPTQARHPDHPDSPDSPTPAAQPSPTAALQQAIVALTGEATLARSTGRLTRQTADFAQRFEHDLNRELLARKLLRALDRDPFIDAYVRWQLTSFKPVLPAMSDRQFDAFLLSLPEYAHNPRADERLVNDLLALRQAGPLAPETRGALPGVLDDMTRRSSACVTFNQPVTQLWDWVESAAGDADGRTLGVMLARCSVMIAGGWDVRDLKAKLDDRFAAAARDEKLTADRRRRLVLQAQLLAGQRRLWITSAVIVENSLQVDTAETAVYDFDVTRWTRPLLDQHD